MQEDGKEEKEEIIAVDLCDDGYIDTGNTNNRKRSSEKWKAIEIQQIMAEYKRLHGIARG